VGDLHVHTALSLDAATQDTRARPAASWPRRLRRAGDVSPPDSHSPRDCSLSTGGVGKGGASPPRGP
jgi:hypothetical protein